MTGGSVGLDILAAAYGIRSLIGIVVYKLEESDRTGENVCVGEAIAAHCRSRG